MEQLIEDVGKFLNSGDPEVRTFFMVRNNYLPFIVCGFYAIFSTKIGPVIMKDRKPFNLRSIMIAFNFFIVVAYVICTVAFFWNLPEVSGFEFCKKFVVTKGHITYKMATIFWWIYMLKYVELFDTVFFILRKRENQVTFLHVFHHTIVPLIGWLLFRTETNGMHSVPTFLNVFVHVIMYTYYGLAAMGPKFKKYLWWKKYLTQLQMIQFFIMVAFAAFIGPITGCPVSTFGRFVEIIFAPLFFYLFYKFYQSTFQKKPASSNLGTEKPSLANGTAEKYRKEMNGNGVLKSEIGGNGVLNRKACAE